MIVEGGAVGYGGVCYACIVNSGIENCPVGIGAVLDGGLVYYAGCDVGSQNGAV